MTEALVIKTTGSNYLVETPQGLQHNCTLAGRVRRHGHRSTNPVVVGDHVRIEPRTDTEWVIVKLIERKNYIVRKSVNLSKQKHIIASNLDMALLCCSLKGPQTSLEFIDRFIVSASLHGVDVTLYFNKVGLLDASEKQELETITELYSQLGYRVIIGDLLEGLNPEILEVLKGKKTLLSGHSGVGKSTLLNTLDPSLNIDVADISEVHQSGVHTTTFAQMHKLELDGETAYIVDSPGIRGFGVISDMTEQDVAHHFVEFFEYASECKFSDCKHINEPKCAVMQAIEEEEISLSRYKSYLSMIKEIQEEGYNYR